MDYDPEVVLALAVRAKQQIRRRMRALRLALPESAVAERSSKICRHLADSAIYQHAGRVALFWPMEKKNEVDLRPLDRLARAEGKAVLYPMMDGDTSIGMSLRYADSDELAERDHGFAEPPASARVAESGADLLIVVPALAIGPDGHRVGYGRGCYDRLLQEMAPPALAVAVAFHFQLLAEVPATQGDRAVSWIATDAGLRKAEPSELPAGAISVPSQCP